MSDSTTQEAEDIIAAAMDEAGVSNYEISYEPANKSDIVTKLEPVTVAVRVNYADVAYFAPSFFNGSAITGSSTMPAEVTE